MLSFCSIDFLLNSFAERCEESTIYPYFASMTQSQDNLHDFAFPKVKHTEPGVRLCFYHKLRNRGEKSFLYIFKSLVD